MSEIHQQTGEVDPISAGHEPSDVGIKPAVIFAASLIVMALIVSAALGGMMSLFQSDAKTLGLSKPALFKDDSGQFSGPKLQRNTTDDMAKFRDHERDMLNSYGWVDPKAGVARIPIDRALEIMAERGLPTKDTKPKPTEPKGQP